MPKPHGSIDSGSLFDALVVGAGPAGSIAARELSRLGWRILLVERATAGRDRVCGGFLGPEVVSTMAEAGLHESLSELAAVPLRRVIFSGPRLPAIEANLPGSGGRGVHRATFDRWLTDQAASAGTTVCFDAEVKRARRIGALWQAVVQHRGEEASEPVSAKAMILACGRRHPRVPPHLRSRQFFGCKAIYAGCSSREPHVSLHFVRAGHVGFDPLPDGRLVMCLYVERTHLDAVKGDLDHMMERLAGENSQIAEVLRGGSRVSPWIGCDANADGHEQFFENGAFLVGDAVTMVNPIIGGGMSIAMGSALLLARLLVEGRAQQHDDRAIASAYTQAWRARFSRLVSFGRWLGWCEQSPVATRAILQLIRFRPHLLARLVLYSRPSVIDW